MVYEEKLTRRDRSRMLPEFENHPRWRSWLASFSIHVGIFLVLAWLWRPIVHGTGGAPDRPIGIAVVHQHDGKTEYHLESLGKSNQDDSDSSNDADSLQAISAVMADLSPATSTSVESLLGEFASSLNQGDLSSSESSPGGVAGLSGKGAGSQGSGQTRPAQTKTTLFGIEGYGNSFVYVFDRSDSMNGFNAGPLRAAKRELLQSIESLTSVNQFQIIFYNEAPSVYQSSLSASRRMIFGTDPEKNVAREYIRTSAAFGGTDHLPALRLGLGFNPDILFFLTDGADPSLNGRQVAEIVERARSRSTTIHAIEFGVGPNIGLGKWIVELAQGTGGEYRYMDVSTFR